MKRFKNKMLKKINISITPVIGMVEWFRPGEHDRVEKVIADFKTLGVKDLRTGFSWADWHTEEGNKWYKWLMPRLAKEVEILPCFSYTPPSMGIVNKTSSPPKNSKSFADFIDVIISEYGEHFTWLELWNEPNNINEWDWRLDPNWTIFSDMIGKAAYWAKHKGKKTVLGGMSPIDHNWLELMYEREVLTHIDAIGLHGFPNTWEFDWSEWDNVISKVQDVIINHDLESEIWITEAGYSTWRHDELNQLLEFAKLCEVPVQRVYWYSAEDLHPDLPHQDVFHGDERHYHFGIKKTDGTPKLLSRVWQNEGIRGVKDMAKFIQSSCENYPIKTAVIKEPLRRFSTTNGNGKTHRKHNNKYTLITGGAGFIGTNVADRILSGGKPVLVFDNLSRAGVEKNLQWLCNTYGNLVKVEIADVRDPYALRRAVQGSDQVFHFAAQVAVTTSIDDPITDFEVNVRGTLNLLESIRSQTIPPKLLFTSTNKVYGDLKDIDLIPNGLRYEPSDEFIKFNGISEARYLDFHSPYGCSKGSADQYIIDYSKTYKIPVVVFRMSCIYGPHQFGTEDQGWVAHFLIQGLNGRELSIYGDGRQVRDILYVEDLVDAMLLAHEKIQATNGRAFNIGGGPKNTISLLELLNYMTEINGRKPEIKYSTWRRGDQKYYVSNINTFRKATGWMPRVGAPEGISRLNEWLSENIVITTSDIKSKEIVQ